MDGPTASNPDAPRGQQQRRHQNITDDITTKKSMFVVVIVVGCFAVLWPKVFYPMLIGNVNQSIQPNAMDKAAGCCDVFSESDVNTIELMSELCSNIIDQKAEKPPSGKEIVSRCRKEVLETCGIDISAVLQEQIRFGRTIKQILNEVRSLNGSLCLKYHYGVSPWRLGVSHKVNVNYTTNIKQERPPNMRPDMVHPAFRERGSAIPKPPGTQMPRKQIRTVEGRPGPVPGMRPTIGGPGHVVPPSQKGGGTMGILMPIYTIGIVIFFTYTLMKLIFKRENVGVRGNLYPPVDPDPRFRREVFESERCRFKPRLSRDPTGRIGWKERDAIVNAMSALLDEVNEEIEARRKANEAKNQAKLDHNVSNGNLSNGTVHKDQEQASVKVLGMETTASCEGGEKWTKPGEPVMAHVVPKIEVAPPQEIYLEGALPAQSQILVADSATVTQAAASDTTSSDPAVVLAGKMTLSVISMDNAQEEDAEIKNDNVVDVNGDENADDIEESKYTTASSATAAEHEISDEQGTDDEGVNEEVERICDLDLDVNHISLPAEGEEEEIVEESNEDKPVEEVENNFVVVMEGTSQDEHKEKESSEEQEVVKKKEGGGGGELEVKVEEVDDEVDEDEDEVDEEEEEEIEEDDDAEEDIEDFYLGDEQVKRKIEKLISSSENRIPSDQVDVTDKDKSDQVGNVTNEGQSS